MDQAVSRRDVRSSVSAGPLVFGVATVFAVAALGLMFRDGLETMVRDWSKEEYSHGYVIPLIAILLVIQKRREHWIKPYRAATCAPVFPPAPWFLAWPRCSPLPPSGSCSAMVWKRWSGIGPKKNTAMATSFRSSRSCSSFKSGGNSVPWGCRSRFYRTKKDCKILGANGQNHVAQYYDRPERAKDYGGVWGRVVARRGRKRPNVT